MSAYELQVHPEADTEYDQFVNHDRSMAFDVGGHFRILESFVESGPPNSTRPVICQKGCDVYKIYGGKLIMFIAIYEQQVLLVQLSEIGTEHEDAEALANAFERAERYFQL